MSVVSLGDMPFNLEEATNIPHAHTLPNLLSSDVTAISKERSPHAGSRRQRLLRISRDDSFDDGDVGGASGSVVFNLKAAPLEDIEESATAATCTVPENESETRAPEVKLKPARLLETDLDNLSVSSRSTVTSRSDVTSSSRSQTPVPSINVTDDVDASSGDQKKDATLTSSSALCSSGEYQNKPYRSPSEAEVGHGDVSGAGSSVASGSNTSHAAVSDENKNLLRLNVDEKGNVVKISVSGRAASPVTAAAAQGRQNEALAVTTTTQMSLASQTRTAAANGKQVALQGI